ncbi:MAG: hypothetical protein QGI83_15690 [Candidatus Latescibacteria bacterium]|jgi:chromosome segregation ATPase|nr:hypothetical protein [Candidatus Latescibacterota bacterium]
MKMTRSRARAGGSSRWGSIAILVTLAAILTSCDKEAEDLQARIAAQQQKVSRAAASRDSASARLEALRDSLQIKVQQNIDLGMPREKAEAIEKALLNSQKALVAAEEKNLKLQEEYLDLLSTRLRTIGGDG